MSTTWRPSPLAVIASAPVLLLVFCAVSTDAAAGYPLTRPEMMFEPLSCNSDLEDSSLDCSTSLESLIAETAPGDNVVVPCGTCATLTTGDGSLLNLTASLDVQGKLLVPASAQATLRTTAVFVQGLLQIDPPTNLDGLKVSLYGVDDVFFTPHSENSSKCPSEGCNVSSKAVIAAGGQFDIRGDQIAAEGATCKSWTTLYDAKTSHPILPSDPVCRTDGSPLEVGAEGTFESGSLDGFQRYRNGQIILADDDLNPGNTYVRNSGRANTKDGLYILSGDHQTCLMRNRLYELKFKYRLDLQGEHRPNVMIHVGDRDNNNQRDIAHESLAPSIDGAWASATVRFDTNDIPDAGDFNLIINWPTSADADAGYDDISVLPVVSNLPTDPVCRADGSPLEVGADGTFESESMDGFQKYRWGEVKIVEDDVALGNMYLRNTGRTNDKDGLTILSGVHQTCLMHNSMYEMKIKYRLDLQGEHRPQISIDVQDRNNENQRVIAHESLPPSINGAWASATVQFDSRDIPDLSDFSIRVNWPTSPTAEAGYDDISILPINTNPPGKPDVLFVDSATAACWAPKVGSTLLVTSNEIGQLKSGWDAEDTATIESIDVNTGAIKLFFPLDHYKTTEAQDPRFATEVAVLHRSTVFEAEEDNPLIDYIGGHSIVLHTAAKQLISGAAFYNFGQQGKLGKYPIHFHMSGDHSSSVVSKNLVQNSKQRCYVIHGTDGVQVIDNVAYDTIGHCYMNENGVEEDIQFIGNLGALTKKQPEERLIGESDHRAYTFWFTNANVKVEGNVAAGANLGGYWYETFERGPHGPYADWPEYADFNPKQRPLGSFIDNVVHSSGERGIRMYEPGFKPLEEFTFYNTRAYKNNEHGIFIHGVQYMVMDGGVFADNTVNIRNFNDRTIFRNLELIGTSDLVRERDPTNCHGGTGLQQRVNPGWNDGAILENVTFSGLNKGYDCNQTGVKFYHLTNVKIFQGNVQFSNVKMEPGTDRKDLLRIECRWGEDPYNMKNIIVEDHDGTIGLTGSPGFYVMDDPTVLSWIPDASRTPDNSCGVYCDNVCLRNVQVKTPGCGREDSCFNHIMEISNGIDRVYYERHVDQSDEKKDLYEAVLPKGNYEILFYNENGDLVESMTPADIIITFGDIPQCSEYVQEVDIGLKTNAPTVAPTSNNPPIHSSAILSSSDPIVKLGLHQFTSDPALAIDQSTSQYKVYTTDWVRPCFSVTPSQPTIVQELIVYMGQERYKKDPRQYKLEGRAGPTDEWTLIKEGILHTNNDRNSAESPITEASHNVRVKFENTVAYNEYRVWFPENRGNSYWVIVGDVQFGGFLVSGINVQLTSPYPAGAVCGASTECRSGLCGGEGICA